jgi:hypothetical protein
MRRAHSTPQTDPCPYLFTKGVNMSGLVEIIAAVIGLLLLTSVVLFIFSIAGKWKMSFRIYFGCAVFLVSHLLLFYLVAFVEKIPLPSILTKYSSWMMNLLAKLLPV